MKNLLLVVANGGPPLDFSLPRLAALARIHVLILVEPNDFNHEQIKRHAASIFRDCSFEAKGLKDSIVSRAQAIQADAILTFSEYALVPVSEACQELGLKGPGRNVQLARDKVLMRDAWYAAGLPSPRHIKVRALGDLREAYRMLRKPFVLKDATGAGSVGCQVINDGDDLDTIYSRIVDVLDEAAESKKKDYSESGDSYVLIAEEFIQATTEGWYDQDGFADFISVEGLVVEGRYHALAVTSRMKALPPFIETSDQSPCLIPDSLHRRISDLAGRAVDALCLENCATHTEIKLQANGELCLIETAARVGGMAIARQLDQVWRLDIVTLLGQILLGEACDIPPLRVEGDARRAAASLAVIGADSNGNPWSRPLPFFPDQIDWVRISEDEDIQVRVEWAQSGKAGALVHPYDEFRGVLNYWGMLFVDAPDARRLNRVCLNIMDNLEKELRMLADILSQPARRPMVRV